MLRLRVLTSPVVVYSVQRESSVQRGSSQGHGSPATPNITQQFSVSSGSSSQCPQHHNTATPHQFQIHRHYLPIWKWVAAAVIKWHRFHINQSVRMLASICMLWLCHVTAPPWWPDCVVSSVCCWSGHTACTRADTRQCKHMAMLDCSKIGKTIQHQYTYISWSC